jgi:hypothetical protein
MRRFFPPGVIAFAGVLGIAAGAGPAPTVPAAQNVPKPASKPDRRGAILRKFMKAKEAPILDFAEVFVAEADLHDLDWRLLPSLAFVESGAGKTAKGNNIFGWNNGHRTYDTINEAIQEVATALSIARPYRGKSLMEKLASYNQGIDYAPLVLQVMRQIYPQAQVEAALE